MARRRQKQVNEKTEKKLPVFPIQCQLKTDFKNFMQD